MSGGGSGRGGRVQGRDVLEWCEGCRQHPLFGGCRPCQPPPPAPNGPSTDLANCRKLLPTLSQPPVPSLAATLEPPPLSSPSLRPTQALGTSKQQPHTSSPFQHVQSSSAECSSSVEWWVGLPGAHAHIAPPPPPGVNQCPPPPALRFSSGLLFRTMALPSRGVLRDKFFQVKKPGLSLVALCLQPPSVTLQPPSVTIHPPSVTLQLPSVALQPPSVIP